MGLKIKIKIIMKIEIIEKGKNEENQTVYYLITEFPGRDTKVEKLTEKELKNFSVKLYNLVDKLDIK